MTARTPSTLDKNGTGRGKKVVTKPQTKKRGASADRTQTIADNRAKYTDLSSIPAAELGDFVDPDKPLTEKAKQFVKFWAQGESVINASARAGYGDGATYAYRVAKFPQAIALYNAEKALYEESCQMTRKKVMDGLLEGVEMAKMMAEPATVINGWKTIGQLCGYFEPIKHKVEVSVTGNIVLDRMNRLSDEELLKLIDQGITEQVYQLPGEDK